MTVKRKEKYVKWGMDEYYPIQQLINELQEERHGRVYDNRVLIEAAEFYKKYRKLVG